MTCASPSNRDFLLALYDMTDGPNWSKNDQWGTPAPLKDWYGVRVDESGRVNALMLGSNRLEGEIPAELGRLSDLRILDLSVNELEGTIPAELGSLTHLISLFLSRNKLEGEIPAELGRLSNLVILDLGWNELEGEIPAELGHLSNLGFLDLVGNQLTGEIRTELLSLSKLRYLVLSRNSLTGQIPVELSRLSNLEGLHLDGNELTGSVPPELGQMHTLITVGLAHNARMSGDLPAGLTSLTRLEAFLAGGTDLCAPADARFQNWLDGVWKRQIAPCSRGDLPKAYLTQAAQSRVFPVPLVAGEKALLRVFATSAHETDAALPPVRTTFFRDGTPLHVVNIPGKPASIPNEVEEGDLTASLNAEIPAWVIQPGLEMVIDIDPKRTLDSRLSVTKRIPERGRLAVEVRRMPRFHLTVTPLLWRQNPDSSTVEMAKGMEQDPEAHELLQDTRTLLPIAELEVKAHAPVLTLTNDIHELAHELRAIRAMERSNGYYLGLIAGAFEGKAGRAFMPGWTSVASVDSDVIAHEIGHNLNLQHALCGGTPNADPSFPDPYGSIGVWGYDFREGGRLVPPRWRDLMIFCRSKWISNYHTTKWIGEYHFTNALRYRLHTAAQSAVSSLVAAPANSLLLWGGEDAAGVPFLEPVFVVDAPASLPRSVGDYEITGRTSSGDELFSLSFDMPELADGDGRSSFVFVLPAKPEWADQLASILLSGPHGEVTLDKNTDRTVTILRDPKTEQIRGILRDADPDTLARDRSVSALWSDAGLERLTSRGIPDPEDWDR